MNRFIRTAAIASTLGLATAGLALTPAAAASDDYVTYEQVDETITLKKGEACDFPMKLVLKAKITIFEKDRTMVTTYDGSGQVSNARTGKTFRSKADGVFVDHISRNGNRMTSEGYGHQVFWGDLAYGKGDPERGMLYVDGTTKFVTKNVKDEANSTIHFKSIEGKRVDLCRRLG